MSTDLVASRNADKDDGLEVYPNKETNINTGIYFVRSNQGERAGHTRPGGEEAPTAGSMNLHAVSIIRWLAAQQMPSLLPTVPADAAASTAALPPPQLARSS